MAEQMNLGGAWRMREADSETWHSAHVPGSVYADLMADGTMPDPFWRENELDAFERMKKDYVYQRTFTVTEAQLAHAHVELVCEGLDTLALRRRIPSRALPLPSSRSTESANQIGFPACFRPCAAAPSRPTPR